LKEELPPNVELVEVYSLKEEEIAPGKPTREAGIAQFEYVKRAVEEAKRGEIEAIITLPINKAVIREAGFNFPGHTEYLAESFGVKEFAMMLSNGRLSVALLTTHLPLSEVPPLVKREKIVSKLKLLRESLGNVKIGVCALNPHAGEGGLFGREEIEEIEPAVKEARAAGIEAYGPLPSDTIFVKAASGEYDVVLALYHDQGLIPIKLLGFNRSVNITLGLPIVRTSVDHGTAYEIAGKGVASEESFKLAVKKALSLLESKQPHF